MIKVLSLPSYVCSVPLAAVNLPSPASPRTDFTLSAAHTQCPISYQNDITAKKYLFVRNNSMSRARFHSTKKSEERGGK